MKYMTRKAFGGSFTHVFTEVSMDGIIEWFERLDDVWQREEREVDATISAIVGAHTKGQRNNTMFHFELELWKFLVYEYLMEEYNVQR